METGLYHFFFHPLKQWAAVGRSAAPSGRYRTHLCSPSRPRWCCGTGRPWTRRCGCAGWPRPRSCWRPPSWSWGTGASGPRGGRCWSPPPGEKLSVRSLIKNLSGLKQEHDVNTEEKQTLFHLISIYYLKLCKYTNVINETVEERHWSAAVLLPAGWPKAKTKLYPDHLQNSNNPFFCFLFFS